jgi:spermidine/putrescine transport system substrate-binding protein
MRRIWLWISLLLLPIAAGAEERIVNVYAWTGEIPEFAVRQFERETGIKVNFSTYENNEIMYAKLRASANNGYDVIIPTSYFVDRMRKQDMLEKLDKTQIPNLKNLDPSFLNPAYDPESAYGVPHIWGLTGIFYNDRFYQEKNLNRWGSFWDPRLHNQLMMIDDMREVFSMALLSLGHTANDSNPEHIKAAFLKLKTLMHNVKVFSSDTLISIMIDEDATVGMAWNGDAFKASLDNPHVKFIYPKEGFVIWVDNFVIPRTAPHKDTAYAFINFILRPDVAKAVALSINFPTANLTARNMLPESVRNSPVAYPSRQTLKHGQFLLDLDPNTLAIYEKYWEELKISG